MSAETREGFERDRELVRLIDIELGHWRWLKTIPGEVRAERIIASLLSLREFYAAPSPYRQVRRQSMEHIAKRVASSRATMASRAELNGAGGAD